MKERYTTTIDKNLIDKVRNIVKTNNLKGTNVIFDTALTDYFNKPIIYEKPMNNGVIHRLVVRNNLITLEIISHIIILDNIDINSININEFKKVD